MIRVGSAGNIAAGHVPWVAYRYHGVMSQGTMLDADRELYGDCYIDAETRRRVDPQTVKVLDDVAPKNGFHPDPKRSELVPFTLEAVREFLDNAIVAWRAKREIPAFAHVAPHYVDAFQSLRTSLFGETLP